MLKKQRIGLKKQPESVVSSCCVKIIVYDLIQ